MSRKSRRRMANAVTRFRPLAKLSRPSFTTTYFRPNLRIVEDRRNYHPLSLFRPALTTQGASATKKLARTSNSNVAMRLSQVLRFNAPKKVVLCVRRSRRREVLFAKKLKNGRASKSRNWQSSISCK